MILYFDVSFDPKCFPSPWRENGPLKDDRGNLAKVFFFYKKKTLSGQDREPPFKGGVFIPNSLVVVDGVPNTQIMTGMNI